MNWSAYWQFECGNGGVIAPGRWLWLRAVLWMVLLFGFGLLAFFASLQMRDWLGLPPGSDYASAIIVPALAVLLYGAAVHFADDAPFPNWRLATVLSNFQSACLSGLRSFP